MEVRLKREVDKQDRWGEGCSKGFISDPLPGAGRSQVNRVDKREEDGDQGGRYFLWRGV